MNSFLPTYVVVTPVRDEAAFLHFTISSMVAQTIRPAEWILVDDGSRDQTAAMVNDCARRYSWIRAVHRRDRGFRQPGAGVVEAFYDGYDSLRCRDWEFLVKLDGDLSFPPYFFASILDHFRAHPRLGIAGAYLYHLANGLLELERCPRFHVRGATRVYRRECWEDVGGLIAAPGWDTVDEVRANMLGWNTASFADTAAIHHRLTGGAEGRWRDMIKSGQACYVAGYHPLFLAARFVYRLPSKPYVVGSLGLAAGFVSGYLGRIAQARDPGMVHYVRDQQWRRLCGRPSIWR